MKEGFNWTFGVAPIVMSLLGLALVGVAATTGWQTHLEDEGLAAHLFQLLIFSQPVIVLLFLVTANWRRFLHVVALLALQAITAGLALGALFYFESRGL